MVTPRERVRSCPVAKTKAIVCLGVPAQYRLNLPRYLRVVRLIPLWDTPESRIAYRRVLEKQLLDRLIR